MYSNQLHLFHVQLYLWVIVLPKSKKWDKMIGFTQSSYPAFLTLDEDYKTLLVSNSRAKGDFFFKYPNIHDFFH